MQHEITVFKSIDTTIPEYYDVIDVLNNIKTGKSSILIDKIRKEEDKERRDRLKKNLYWICFSGKFSKRENDALIAHSGLICLDFDDFPNIQTLNMWKTRIKQDKYCFSVFISPSGNGLKVLFKIPVCTTNEQHNLIFDSIADYFFDCKYFDRNGKGVVRVCYESYDRDLYVNKESVVYTDSKQPQVRYNNNQLSEVDLSYTDIFEKLIIWFERNFNLKKGNRNSSLFYLLSACRDYGISEIDANILVSNYASTKAEDFASIYPEIPTIIKSAYSKPAANKKMKIVSMDAIANNEDESILDNGFIFDFDENISVQQVDTVTYEELPDEFVFWKWTGNAFKIDFVLFKVFIQKQGFYIYKIDDSEMFIRICDNVVEAIDVVDIKRFVLECLLKWDKHDIYNMIAENAKFVKQYLNYLDIRQISWNKDCAKYGWTYFKNTAVRVSKNSIETIPYSQLKGSIWKYQVVDRNFKLLSQEESNRTDFSKFVGNICSNDAGRISAYRAAMGYLIHRFKSKSTVKAIILNDEFIADVAMGGTGKGLTMQVISSLRNVVIIPGADFDSSKDFAWQRLDLYTDIVLIDDIDRNFKYKKLFTFITDGWPVRKLFTKEIYLPPEDSPKVVINTNYILKEDSDSYARRKHELELSHYYNKNHQPCDDFDKEFINGWDEREFNLCDNYLLYCLKHFLANGLIEPKFISLKYKKLVLNTSEDFVAFADTYMVPNSRYKKQDLYKFYKEELSLTPNDYPNQKIFTSWMEYWAIDKGIHYSSRAGAGGVFFDFGNPDTLWSYNSRPF